MTEVDRRPDLSRAVWRKSSRSNGGADGCVEISPLNSDHAVRDSKAPDGATLVFDGSAWRAFHAQVKAGSHDL